MEDQFLPSPETVDTILIKDSEDQFKNVNTKVAKDPKIVDADLDARVKAEQAKFPNLPPKYVGFTVKFKCFWIWINVFGILSSIAMASGSLMILGADQKANSFAYQECIAMKVVCWALFALHICNFLFSALALCGLEKRICISQVLLALVIFDGIVLIWA